MTELRFYRTEHGEKTVLAGPHARTLMPILLIEGSGLTLRKVPISEEKYMRPAPTSKKTIKGIAKQYRAIGNKLGMSKAAKAFLTSITNAA